MYRGVKERGSHVNKAPTLWHLETFLVNSHTNVHHHLLELLWYYIGSQVIDKNFVWRGRRLLCSWVHIFGGGCWRWNFYCGGSSLVTDSILFCWLFTIKNLCKQVLPSFTKLPAAEVCQRNFRSIKIQGLRYLKNDIKWPNLRWVQRVWLG